MDWGNWRLDMGNLLILCRYPTVNDLQLKLRAWLVMAKKPYFFQDT